MRLLDAPIRRKLMSIMLLTSGLVLALTVVAFLAYEIVSFRSNSISRASTVAGIIANNSTAALAFRNEDDARQVLSALRSARHLVAAALYDEDGRLFAVYPEGTSASSLPPTPSRLGFRFERGGLVGFEPVVEGDRRLGTLYLHADLGALYERLVLYALIAALVCGVAFAAAYFLATKLQRQISDPILTLAELAKVVSERQDYSVRAPKHGRDEIGVLTESFNQMLTRVQQADERLHAQLARLSLLHRITRAIGERQDLRSIFKVIISSLEQDLPIDAGWICLYEPGQHRLTVSGVGAQSLPLASALALTEGTHIPIDANGLSRCMRGQLVYEPDISEVDAPFTQRLAGQGLRSLVAAPLAVESHVFGALLVARWEANAFTSPDCEFLRHLSEHVALAANQAQIYGALQHAYDDLRHSQQAVLQHERLRALGEMASGIAHDINNTVSPVALYSEMMLQSEQGLTSEGREYLETIQRAMEDVAATVARLREFYRPREPQMTLAPTDVNQVVRQVVHLTRARWHDMPQQHGITIKAVVECAPELPMIMAVEGELREALTNLVFNGVDAMPQGGILTIRTSVTGRKPESSAQLDEREVHVEVTDTGVGMDEATRQRCLEPFFTTKGERGTGLGLAMVYGTLQRHSADISIDSAPGKGTTIRLTFAVPAQIEQGTGLIAAPLVVEPLDILVVDDDPLILQALRDALESGGHRVVTATGGQAGMDEFRAALADSRPFAVVITDLGMPHVDGRQVTGAVKQASPETPVIMLTGWGRRMADDGDVPEGVDRVLGKPPKLREINSTLAQLRMRGGEA